MRNGRGGRSAGLRIGIAGSLIAHVGLLVVLSGFGRRAPAVDGLSALDAAPVTIAVTALEVPPETAVADPGDPPLSDELPEVPRPADAPDGERDNPVAVTVAPADGDGRLRAAPAPDSGLGAGAPADHAWRRDRTTLRARLTDGAAEAQPARLRTLRRPASPQAIRREPMVGLGDAAWTHLPTRAAGPAVARAERVLAQGGDPANAARDASQAARAATPSSAARVADEAAPERALGPLDAERGRRSFDEERPGAASDNQTMRAASNEAHPGLTDFSRAAASAPAPTADGHGPGAAPGAVARASSGVAPALFGARSPGVVGPDVNERTAERRYDRYKLEIKQRVNDVLEFPRALALRLEQGQTVVEFLVDVDGRIGDGPRVVKSSGFPEFDNAALRAVRRAAPFPPMADRRSARPLPVSMPVTFDNPVIR